MYRRYPFPRAFVCLLVVVLMTLASNAMAARQPARTIQAVISRTNVAKLLSFSRQKSSEYRINKQKALQLAAQKGWIIRRDHDRGLMELQGVSKNGLPLYYITHNSVAAQSTSTDRVWPGASADLHLDGTGMIAGEWDGGDVRGSHQEFNNTGVSRVIDKDGASATHYHSTHVAGTIIAGGVQANAKGMAYNATLDAYDWNNDESEMAAAAANGLLISNHSYGYSAGWTWNGSSWQWEGDTSISSSEDFQFGFYSDFTRDLDTVAANAPYYLIVKAAGNDRGNGDGQWLHPKDGGDDGYDCIAYKAVAKNVLTVGAVMDIPGGYTEPSDVVMTSFSSWGPIDDGRIKPDICGNGYNLYSTYDKSDSDYDSISGTSMASPNVTGSLLLLQEHYNNLYGGYMTAASLKALVLHTADEAGPDDGPDYMFGWGMLNTETAARTISDKDVTSLILEETYHPDTLYSQTVMASGTEPLVVTVVWTDPAGTPVADQLDPTNIMLVNDLDVRLSDGTSTWYPYKLDVHNPSAAATTGDNDVDNVEKIVITAPTAGSYTITIVHEGTISGASQDFSLVVTGILNGNYIQVTTADASSVTAYSAILSGSVSTDGESPVTETGLVWGTAANPTTNDNIYSVPGDTDFSTTATELSAMTHYYFRAYAINSDGITYGSNKSFTTTCGTISAFPWAEQFDSSSWPLQCWADFQLGDAAGWQKSTSQSHSASGSLFHNDDNVSDNANDWLVLPAFDFSDKTDIVLNFWQRENYASWIDYHSVKISTDSDGTPGSGTWTELYSGAGTEDSWQEITLSLNAYSGEENVHIAFQYIGDYADEWWIDDISVTATTVIPRYLVNITLSGSGSGGVTATGIDCPGDCSESYDAGTTLSLAALADTGSRFGQWQGDADCQDGELTVNSNLDCTAVFIRQYLLETSVSGYGTVSGAGIHCPGDCSETVDTGTQISLTPTPATGSHFVNWSGDCSGSGNCDINMDQPHSVSATFAVDPVQNTLDVTVSGNGTVASAPVGISCTDSGNACTAEFMEGDMVRLTATPDAQTTFSGWSGDCSGNDLSCEVLMDQARSVSALFSDQTFELRVVTAGKGNGTISSSPAGIDCGTDCAELYPAGSQVILTAAPASHSIFSGWSGNCDEANTTPPSLTCTVSMQQAEEITGTFTPVFPWPLFYTIITGSGR